MTFAKTDFGKNVVAHVFTGLLNDDFRGERVSSSGGDERASRHGAVIYSCPKRIGLSAAAAAGSLSTQTRIHAHAHVHTPVVRTRSFVVFTVVA